MNRFTYTTAKGFGKSHTNFGVLLSMHAWVMTVGGGGGEVEDADFFLGTLMLVHVSSKKMCLQRPSTYHLKAHRISNNVVLKLLARSKRGGGGGGGGGERERSYDD